MKKWIVFINIILIYLFPAPALEYGDELYAPGWWCGMTDDSFGFGIPADGDDQHTVGFQGGFKTNTLSAALFYDVYTHRGASPADHTRTDRVRLLLGLQDSLSLGPANLTGQLALLLGMDGNCGGYWIQHLFHISFANYRLIPQLSDYDTLTFFSGLQFCGATSVPWGGWRAGLAVNSVFTYPLLLTLEPALFFQYPGGNSSLHLAAAWVFTPAAEGFQTYNLVCRQTDGLWLNGYCAAGPLFYHFSYNPLKLMTDGRIGYHWSKRYPGAGQPLWDMMTAEIELINLGATVVYEENTSLGLFFESGIPGGYYQLQLKNGGLYDDNALTHTVRNFACGVGYEQHLPAVGMNGSYPDPFLGMNLFIEHLQEQSIPAFRSTPLAEMGVLGSSLEAGLGLWLPELPGSEDKTGLRLSAFVTLPHLTFGSGQAAPGLTLAHQLRWGIRVGLMSRP